MPADKLVNALADKLAEGQLDGPLGGPLGGLEAPAGLVHIGHVLREHSDAWSTWRRMNTAAEKRTEAAMRTATCALACAMQVTGRAVEASQVVALMTKRMQVAASLVVSAVVCWAWAASPSGSARSAQPTWRDGRSFDRFFGRPPAARSALSAH